MASRRQQAVRDWQRDQASDLRNLPHATRLVRPGSYGTFAGRTKGSAPEAPTLDDGPLYTGEWREEVDGNELVVPLSEEGHKPFVVLASLRRPWPYVGFAFDTKQFPHNATVTVGLLILTRSGHAELLANNVGGAPPPLPQLTVTGTNQPFPWVAMTGIFVGARVAVFATAVPSDEASVDEILCKVDLWGYNDAGFGP